MNKIMINEINNLCNNNPYEYLTESSKWFSTNLIDTNHKDCYPYYDSIYNDFFFDKTMSQFEKDVGLKFMVNIDMNDTTKDIEILSKWIVKVWGGIKGIKDSTLKDLVKNLSLKTYPFQNISSWSKIHSFKNVDRDIIYDSKVIYTINWLLLKIDTTESKFYHQPLSRNKRLTNFPIDSIINFKHSDLIDMSLRGEEITKKVYFSKDEVYTKYRDLMHSINLDIWGDKTINLSFMDKQIYMRDYPFFTEMLLFNMSDDVIFKDIREKVSIVID